MNKIRVSSVPAIDIENAIRDLMSPLIYNDPPVLTLNEAFSVIESQLRDYLPKKKFELVWNQLIKEDFLEKVFGNKYRMIP